MGRGHKTCVCGKTMGPRTLVCPHCNHDFGIRQIAAPKVGRLVKVAKVKKAVDNHKVLAPGDKIKVTSGGSYYKNKDGDKLHIGYRGRFVVKAVDQHGIFAYGNKKEGEQSMCYIWMGRNLLTKAGVHRRPHKVVRV